MLTRVSLKVMLMSPRGFDESWISYAPNERMIRMILVRGAKSNLKNWFLCRAAPCHRFIDDFVNLA